VVALSACAGDAADEELSEQVETLSWPGASVDNLVTSKRTREDITNFGCWDVPGGTPRWLNQWPCHARSHQRFRFEWTGSAFRVKLAQDPGQCLDVPGFNYAATQRIQMYPCNGGPNQAWIVHRTTQGAEYASLRPQPASSLCLSIRGDVAVGGAAMELQPCDGSDKQLFRFHTWVGSDGGSCPGAVNFADPSVSVATGASKAFRVAPGPVFDVQCAFASANHIDCDQDRTDLFVVDRLQQVSGYTVRCFKTDPDPVVEPPLGCPAGYECCSGDPVHLCLRGDCARDCGTPN
jgi:hypothetical protein